MRSPGEQLSALRALLSSITPANDFQTQRVAAAGLAADEIGSLDEFIARVPFTRKDELVEDQAARLPYGSNLSFPLEHYTRFCQTSGTTARPLAILDTPESWDWMLENWLAGYAEAGVERTDRIYFAFSFGPFLGFWTAFEAAAKLGCLCLPGGGLSSVGRLRAIIDHGATVLCCTPSYALHLADTAQRERIDLSHAQVRTIMVAGEPGGSIGSVREKIGTAWNGAAVLDHYGMTEVGPVAFQRLHECNVLRIPEERYFAEIIDAQTGAPAAAGTVGELVLTPLGRTAWPLLRYRTGDLVKRMPSEEGFALAGGIIGRVDDMVVVRGVNLYPSAIDSAVRALPAIEEYRVHVSRRGALAEVAIEIEAEDDRAAKQLERSLSEAFALRIPVTCAAPGTLPRFEMKARRWVRDDSP